MKRAPVLRRPSALIPVAWQAFRDSTIATLSFIAIVCLILIWF
ncbi:MAG: hypothetical protein AAGH78_14585 [Cyanobacteria bacterium P01_H01_bin.58]